MMIGIKLLLLRSMRMLSRMRLRGIGIALILGSGMAMYSGVYSSIDSLFQSRDFYYDQGLLADLEIRFIPEDRKNLPEFNGVEGLDTMESRLIMPGNIALKDGTRLSATLFGLHVKKHEEINKLTLLQGLPLDPNIPNGIVIERNLASSHGYKVGDKLKLSIGKDHYNDLLVRGIALSPEFLIASADPSVFLPTKGSLGIIFAPRELMEQRLGYGLINSLLFRFSDSADIDELKTKLTAIADTKFSVDEAITRSNQFSYLFLDMDLNAFGVFLPVIIAIFSITAIVVTLFLLFQWITSERRQIGLLMALGYGRIRLVFGTLLPMLIVAALAAIAGFLLSFITLCGFGLEYANAIGLPEPFLQLGDKRVFYGVVGAIGALIIATIWPGIRIIKLSPQDAVRGDKSKKSHNIDFLNKIFALVGGPLWIRYAFRNLMRGRSASLMTVFSISLALGVSISYFITMTSFETTLVERFKYDKWNVAADFMSPLWNDELDILREVPKIYTYETYVRGVIRIEGSGGHENSLVTGIQPDATLRNISVLQGRMISIMDNNVIVMEQRQANKLGYIIGDTVNLYSRGKEFKTKLIGVFSGTLPGESYASIDSVRNWLDLEDQNTGVLMSVEDPADAQMALFKSNKVGRVNLKSNLLDELLKITRQITSVIYLTEIFSIAVAILFILSSTSFIVLDRSAEYATLRILGFSNALISGTIITEIVLMGIFGALLSIPIGYALAYYLVDQLSSAWFLVDIVMSPRDILVIIVPALILLPFAGWPAIRTILSSSLSKVLRERLFG